MTTYAMPKPASSKQIAFIESLMKTRKHGAVYVGTQLSSYGIDSLDALTSSAASNIIGVLLDEPQVAVEKSAPAKTDLSEGIYGAPNGEVWKIVRSNRGHLYALWLEVKETAKGKKGTWTYVQGAMKQANTWAKMTLEQAAQYGKQTGVCCQCGRTLTNPDSIEAGIGPICAGGF